MATRYDYMQAVKIAKVDEHIVAYQQNADKGAIVINKLNKEKVRESIFNGIFNGEYEYHGSDTLSWVVWNEDKMNEMLKNNPNDVFKEEDVPNYY